MERKNKQPAGQDQSKKRRKREEKKNPLGNKDKKKGKSTKGNQEVKDGSWANKEGIHQEKWYSGMSYNTLS